jgi:urea transport system ATP-binding protein
MSALLEVQGVSVSFDGFRAINNLSFSINEGELRAIIGPNGAGKTTFMDIVTGKTRPDSGAVTWGERSISLLKLSEAAIARAGVGRKFRRPTVFEDQSVAENLILALQSRRGPLAALAFSLSGQGRTRLGEIAAQVGLTDHRARKAGELSHGQKQWLEIGMLLAQEPKLLLVDEPAAGMTLAEGIQPNIIQQIGRVITYLKSKGDMAIVLVEQYFDVAYGLADQFYVLRRGSVAMEGTKATLSRDALKAEVSV